MLRPSFESLGHQWYRVKSYTVNSKDWTCDCQGGTMKIGGKRQKECKHVKEVRQHLGKEKLLQSQQETSAIAGERDLRERGDFGNLWS